MSPEPFHLPVIILDHPAHAGNVGAAARAMANMGFSELRLVAPRQFPHPDAVQFAAGCVDILDGVKIYASVVEAIADLNFLVAATNRHRGQRQTVVTPRQLGEAMAKILTEPQIKSGILFGTERTGLATVDVARGDILCNIPTAGHQGSLNLAQSVLVITYEIMLGLEAGHAFDFSPHCQGPRATAESLDRLFQHMESALKEIGFLKPQQSKHMMGSLRALYHRAALDDREVAILRGILHEMVAFRQRMQE